MQGLTWSTSGIECRLDFGAELAEEPSNGARECTDQHGKWNENGRRVMKRDGERHADADADKTCNGTSERARPVSLVHFARVEQARYAGDEHAAELGVIVR